MTSLQSLPSGAGRAATAGRRRGSRRSVAVAAVALAAAGWIAAIGVAGAPEPEVVATGVPRPLQLALDGDDLIVMGPGSRGDAAGEIYRFSTRGELPVDLSHQPRITIPFADSQAASLGSLALHPVTREFYLGEENGRRVYRMTRDEGLVLYATGLRRLAGGSALAFDQGGRLLAVDFADPSLSESEDKPPPGLEQFREEDYRGPVVFRLELDPAMPLPRRLGKVAPFFPRAWAGKAGGAILPHLIAVASVGGDGVVVLDSRGELYRLDREGPLRPFARLPRGQYNRINLTVAPDGSIVVSGGFHVGQVFRVRPDGAVSVLADNLADPEGVAVDARGNVYVAESSFHRILRLRPF